MELATTLTRGIAKLPQSSASAALMNDAQALLNAIERRVDVTDG